MRIIRSIALLTTTACLQAFTPGPAQAQAYPTKPIKLVVPFPAGGTSDVLARLLGQKLSEAWGQSVVIENKPGSGGNLGADSVAKSPADGHTLVLMDVGTLAISPSLYKLPFNVINDFVPVTMVAYSPHLLVTSSKVPANTTAELIAWVKSKNGTVNFAAAAGIGSAPHLAGVMFAQRTGLQWNYVAYKGGAQALTDLAGGQIDVTFNGMVATYPHVKSGKIKMIAASSAKRMAQLGETPVVSETVPGFVTGSWQGILAPAGTPKAVIDKIHSEIQRIVALPEIKERFATLGAEANGMTPTQFSDWLKAEIKTMSKVVADGKVTLD